MKSLCLPVASCNTEIHLGTLSIHGECGVCNKYNNKSQIPNQGMGPPLPMKVACLSTSPRCCPGHKKVVGILCPGFYPDVTKSSNTTASMSSQASLFSLLPAGHIRRRGEVVDTVLEHIHSAWLSTALEILQFHDAGLNQHKVEGDRVQKSCTPRILGN